MTTINNDKSKTPAKPSMPKGDFARGERTMPPAREGPDFARGEHALSIDVNKDLLQGKWHELKGQVRQRFAKLTDDDVERLSGKMEELSGVLQQKYGYDRAGADLEIINWLREVETKLHTKA